MILGVNCIHIFKVFEKFIIFFCRLQYAYYMHKFYTHSSETTVVDGLRWAQI